VAISALGEKNYWTVLKNCDVVLGNSSSGIIEAPAVPVPVVNIGQRQGGRGYSPCVIDVQDISSESIKRAISRALEKKFREGLSSSDSRYGEGKSAEKIVSILQNIDFSNLLIKTFYTEK